MHPEVMPRSSRAKPEGICALCRRDRPLTFEHIPPRAAGNNDPVWSETLDGWLANGPAFTRTGRSGRKVQQRGAGGHLLCADCNNLLGTTLVVDFAAWATPLRAAFGQAASVLDDADRIDETAVVDVNWRQVRPGAFARQALAMCIVAGGGLPDAARHDALVAAITTTTAQTTTHLPPLTVRYYAGPHIRMGPAAGVLRDTGAGWVATVAWEVAFKPFAFTLTLAGPALDAETYDLRDWLAMPADTRADVDLRAPLGFGHTPLPGDYRTRSAVARQSGDKSVITPERQRAAPAGLATRIRITEPDAPCTVTVAIAGDWRDPERHPSTPASDGSA